MCGRNENDVDKCDGKEVKTIIDDIIQVCTRIRRNRKVKKAEIHSDKI